MCCTLLFVLIASYVLLFTLLVDNGACYYNNSVFFRHNLTIDDVPPPSIVGGEPTLAGEFPFMAALGWIDELGSLDFRCGGMLVSLNMVLTAAHCVFLKGKLPNVVHIGGNSLTEDSLHNRHSVVSATIFPEYNSSQAYHDIALLELDHPTFFPTVCLWSKPHVCVNQATAIGYGLTEFSGHNSEGLLKVNLTIFSQEFCKPFFKRQRKLKFGVSHMQICAGDENGKKDTCQGDSGGPLIVMHDQRPYAIGITSVGQACSGFPPAIYTRISSYIDWIKSVVTDHGYSLPQNYC